MIDTGLAVPAANALSGFFQADDHTKLVLS